MSNPDPNPNCNVATASQGERHVIVISVQIHAGAQLVIVHPKHDITLALALAHRSSSSVVGTVILCSHAVLTDRTLSMALLSYYNYSPIAVLSPFQNLCDLA